MQGKIEGTGRCVKLSA